MINVQLRDMTLIRDRRLTLLWAIILCSFIFPGCNSGERDLYSEKNGWTLEKGYAYKPLTVAEQGKTGFSLLSAETTGITFTNTVQDQQSTANQIRNNGSGVTVGDIDNDGLADIFFASQDGRNVLYKNLGDWTFKDVTEDAGSDIALIGNFSTGANFTDIDGDYDLDLIVGGLDNGASLFLNDGSGKFEKPKNKTGLESKYGTHSMAFADVDGDGDLDIYTANYRSETLRDYGGDIKLQMVNGVLTVPDNLKDRILIDDGKLREYGEPDFLYINDGNGNFSPLSWTDGTFTESDGKKLSGPPLDWGLSVAFRDMDRDGDPDIYVCNDFWSPERIWINDGSGKFRAMDNFAIRQTSATSMGVDFADVDRDGDYEFFVVDMLSRYHKLRKMQMGTMKPTPVSIGEIDNRPQIMRNTFYLNRGDNTYAEIAYYSGLQGSEWSWSPIFIDIDLDGYEDLFITNGHARDVQDSDTNNKIKALNLRDAEAQRQTLLMFPRLETENLAYRNMGNLKFEEVGEKWGLNAMGISHGAATADLDNDGDLDLVVNNLDMTAGIYRNDSNAPRVAVRLKGVAPNTQGIGSEVILKGGPVYQSQEVIAGGRYLSGSDPVLMFAAGDAVDGMTIEVNWRSGKKSIINNVKANHAYVVYEEYAENWERDTPEPEETLFEDKSGLIAHSHHEEEFDDFALQSLLPNRLSQLGPGIAWYDLDRDSDEDLIITSGRGSTTAIYINNGDGTFSGIDSESGPEKAALDQTAAVAWNTGDGISKLVIGQSNFEDHLNPSPSALIYGYGDSSLDLEQELPPRQSATGPVSAADIDGDGDIDLFIGGRTIAGKYPEPASSVLYINEGGKFVPDSQNSPLFESLGMVSGSVFSDLDGDGDPDLVLATEWGPLYVFMNEDGKLRNETDKLGFSDYKGWWNGVTTGDLDGDGKMDIIATNWGLNSKYHLDKEHPLRVYYRDFNDDGTLDVVEAHYDENMKEIVPERGLSCSSNAMPFIKEKTPTYEKYGSSSLIDIYGEGLAASEMATADTLEHMVFLNRGEGFEAVSLPVEAQFTPSFGVGVADFDGDGNEDVFMTQNFFAAQIETPRIDAGRGLLLKGDGKGNLTPVPGQESGIKVYGDQRGAAFSDYDNDGRLDLVVSQNGAETKLYRNIAAEPGLRVRLAGPEGNPDGVGAQIRLVSGSEYGPAREVHAGSGYWSQDSFIQVLAAPREPEQVSVLWPGGEKTLSDIPEGAKEIVVAADGSVEKVK